MLSKLLLAAISTYQRYLRPSMPVNCRFVPSCSDYAKEAIGKYGALRGAWLAIKRILRCNPYSRASGYDPLT